MDDGSKCTAINDIRPKGRGRPPKHYHPLLQREKQFNLIAEGMLLEHLYKRVKQSGSRLAHLYGLPKTYKENLKMRPILSAIGMYSYNLGQWLEEILKPLAQNQFTISDLSKFAEEEINDREIYKGSILVSYDVTALFTNVQVRETIEFLIDKAFKENWLNETYDLN